MRIRYGFTIEIDVSQPTTILTAFDIETRWRGDILWKRPLTAALATRTELYANGFGNHYRRLV